MTIEEKVEAALQDLEGLLSEGAEVEAALIEVANSAGLRPDVLRQRAQRAFGDLEEARAHFSTQSHLLAAVRRYGEAGLLLTSSPPGFSLWFQETYGRPLSSVEIASCEREILKQREDTQHRFLQQALMALSRARVDERDSGIGSDQ